MLVRVTEACRMGCVHCMVDAKPTGAHMSLNTFRQVLSFVRSTGFGILMVSGGEPTEHPDIETMLEQAARSRMRVILLSNGMFLHEDAARRDRILAQVDVAQVTNDPRFYPQLVAPFDHPKVALETAIRQVSPFGRAVANKVSCNRMSPTCFNLRSAVRSTNSFPKAIATLRSTGKFCTPSVNVDGSISAGESPSCSSIGTVWDDDLRLRNLIRDLRCNRCGLAQNLPELHQRIFSGEGA